MPGTKQFDRNGDFDGDVACSKNDHIFSAASLGKK